MKISWADFHKKNSNTKEAFENLCLEHFILRYELKPEQVDRFSNQPGVEIEPLLVTHNGKELFASFQAKHFDNQIDWGKLEKSIKKVIDKKKNKDGAYASLAHITCYINLEIERNSRTKSTIENDTTAVGIDIEWFYRDKLLRVIDQDPRFSSLKKRYFVEYEQPRLYIRQKSVNTDGIGKYNYTERAIEYFGRNEQKKKLYEFLESEKRFQWWIVTGNAGAGKSRLALELCLEREKIWYSGFITEIDELEKLKDGHPDRPTLIVIDYVVGREELISQYLRAFSERDNDNQFVFPVRVLLIERDTKTWLSNFLGAGTEKLTLISTQFSEVPLHLPSFYEESSGIQKNLVEALIKKFNITNIKSDDVLRKARDIDPSGSPLFIYLLADLLSEVDPAAITFCTKEDVVRELLEREAKKRWKPNDVRQVDKELLALASLCGGLDISHIEDLDDPEDALKKYRLMAGLSNSSSLRPLEPDVLGELFVLDFVCLEGTPLPQKFRQIMDKALQQDTDSALLSFFTRAAKDYPNHPTLSCLCSPFDTNEITRKLWAKTVVNVIYYCRSNQDLAFKLFRSLAELLRSFQSEKALHDAVYLAEINLINIVDKDKTLEPWTYQYPTEIIASPQKETDINLSIYAIETISNVEVPEFKYAQTLAMTIERLYEKCELYKSYFFDRLCQIYQALEIHYLSQGELEKSLQTHEKLCNVVLTYPYLHLIYLYSNTSANLLVGMWQFNFFSKKRVLTLNYATQLYEHLVNFRANFSCPDLFIVDLGEMLSMLILFNNDSRERDREKAWKYYDDLEKLFIDYPQFQPELAKSLSAALVNLSSGCGDEQDYKKLKSFLERIRKLEKQLNLPEIRNNLSMALRNLVRPNASIYKRKDEEYYFEILENLCFSYPKESEIAKSFIHEVFSMHHNALNSQYYEKAVKYFNLLKRIINTFPTQFDYFLKDAIEKGLSFSEKQENVEVTKEYLNHYFSMTETSNDDFWLGKMICEIFNMLQRSKNTNKLELAKLYESFLQKICHTCSERNFLQNYRDICKYC